MLSKEDSTLLKGVAITFMVFHHLFAFPDWWSSKILISGSVFPYYSIINEQTISWIASSGRLCIAIFAFLSGYGLRKKAMEGKYSYKKQLINLYKILIPFWMTVILVSLLNIDAVSVKQVLENICLIDFSILPFAWYVRFYILVIISFPIINYLVGIRICNKELPGIILLLGMLGGCFLINRFIGYENPRLICQVVYEYFLYVPLVFTGVCCASYEWIENTVLIIEKYTKYKLSIGIIGIIAVMLVRLYLTKGNIRLDALVVYFFIIFCILITRNPSPLALLRKCINTLGIYSLYIWFFHNMFFYPTTQYQMFAYIPRIPLLILIWVLVLGLIYGRILEKIISFFKTVIKKDRI